MRGRKLPNGVLTSPTGDRVGGGGGGGGSVLLRAFFLRVFLEHVNVPFGFLSLREAFT